MAAARLLALADDLWGLGFYVGLLNGISFSFYRYGCTVGTNILSMISPNFLESFTPDSELISFCKSCNEEFFEKEAEAAFPVDAGALT